MISFPDVLRYLRSFVVFAILCGFSSSCFQINKPPPPPTDASGALLPPAAKRQLIVGDHAPAFTLYDQVGRVVTSSEILGSGNAVLIFVPSLGDPAARPIADWVTRNGSALSQQSHCELLVIAGGDPTANLAIAKTSNLHVAILADDSGTACRAFGLAMGQERYVSRAWTVAVSGDGIIQYVRDAIPPVHEVMSALAISPGHKQESFFDFAK